MRAGVLDGIGSTPLVRLERLVERGMAEVWVKLEVANPTGSYKDRMALAMIEGAERDGRLRPGQTVVEYTGGSTGSSLALVCAIKGYPLRIVTLRRLRSEKLRRCARSAPTSSSSRAPKASRPTLIPRDAWRVPPRSSTETGAFATDQFKNRDMVDGYSSLGRELLEQLDGRIDAYCDYVGTAGCFVGVTRGCGRRGPRSDASP